MALHVGCKVIYYITMNIQNITSSANSRVKHVKALGKRKNRESEGLYVAEGASVVKDLFDHGADIAEVFVAKSALGKYESMITEISDKGMPLFSVNDSIMGSLTAAKSPQGIFAVIRQQSREFDATHLFGGRLAVALDALGDPGNMGTIIRTADAVGADALIIGPGCVDVYNEKVVRASMGSLSSIRIFMAEDLPKAVYDMQATGWKAACGHLAGSDFFERDYFGKTLLVIGNEARGVSAQIADLCDYKWKLPMRGKAESLNAAVAAGIIMYELAIKMAVC